MGDHGNSVSRPRSLDREDPSPWVLGRAQYEAWQERRRPPVEKLDDGLYSIPVPMPQNPLRYVLVYAFADDRSVTLIDAGWESEESWTALVDGLATFGASPADVSGVLLTHYHFDHIGLARRVREASGAWIALHPADAAVISDPRFRDLATAAAHDIASLVRLGATPTEAHAAHPTRSSDPRATFALPDRLLAAGQEIEVAHRRLRTLHTPGHTPGHVSFLDEDTGRLFAGDTLLPRISPNISLYPDPTADPLGDFLSTLDSVATERVDAVLPAHEWRFRDVAHRAAALRLHHEKRLHELWDAIADNPGSTPWELASHMTWSRSWSEYDGYLRVSAVTETAAHAVFLSRHGFVDVTDGDAPRYSTRPGTPWHTLWKSLQYF